ncbi:MAG: heme lyase CcmF/NrfE family subunit, partial [Candidatus Eisenbacteria bacterium]|nr:heme lyase CcmF/NrfE family subunit [Candidatus Eisenbacteria bacterium]
MIQLGEWMLGAAFGASVLTFLLAGAAAVRKDRALMDSAMRSMVATAFFTTVAAAGLLYALLAGDYNLTYVWGHSDRDMSTFYKIGAFWGGQEGSLLFWALLLGFYATVVVVRHRRDRLELMAPALATIAVIHAFFIGLNVFVASPFERIPDFIPPDGRGLNPLLQHPSMVIHPPSLYIGFVGMAIPFALAMGALISGRLDDEWIRKSRVWAVFAWIFLGAGNIIGGRWAYVEL